MDHRAGWRAEADLVAELLGDTDLTGRVPGCPEWNVADLAFHLGWVYDRFTRIAGQRLTERDQIRGLGSIDRPENDRVLPGWFRSRCSVLQEVLTNLGDDEAVWNYTRTPHVGRWLPRRMHHETTVHRHDMQACRGETTPIDPAVARDGIEEYLTVLSTAARRWDGSRPVVLRVEEVDRGPAWQLRLDPGDRAVPDTSDTPDLILRSTPESLLLVLWRRTPLASVGLEGPQHLAATVLATLAR